MSKLIVDTVENTAGTFTSGIDSLGPSTNYGAVGSYFFGLSSDQASSATLAAGMTTAGSTLGYYSYVGAIYPSYHLITYNNRKTSAGLPGTWRMMNGPLAGGAGGPYVIASLHVRIS